MSTSSPLRARDGAKLAAGSIRYVVIQLLKVAARQGFAEVLMWGVLLGLIVGFATDYVPVAAGA